MAWSNGKIMAKMVVVLVVAGDPKIGTVAKHVGDQKDLRSNHTLSVFVGSVFSTRTSSLKGGSATDGSRCFLVASSARVEVLQQRGQQQLPCNPLRFHIHQPLVPMQKDVMMIMSVLVWP